VIRFNGGAQAAHNVVAPDGRHHTFAQFGAGTLHGVPTHLSRFMAVEPFALAAEASHLASLGVPDPFALLSVDRRALLTTPYHRAANRVREAARSGERHGSCGVGFGETVAYSLDVPFDEAPRVGDCQSPATLAAKLARLREGLGADLASAGLDLPDDLPAPEFCAEVYAAFAGRTRIVGEEHLPRLLADGPCVFEGAQGVLLDEWYGFHPHTTWSTTTFANASALLADAGLAADDAFRLGVVRTYTTRHGAGPLVTEDRRPEAAVPEAHNGTGEWQGAFRTGPFDMVAHRYAVEVCGRVDGLAVGHVDVVRPGFQVCRGYRLPGAGDLVGNLPVSPVPDLEHQQVLTKTLGMVKPVFEEGPEHAAEWPGFLAAELGVPLTLVSRGPEWTRKTLA
jgi:adenylosuccinate synthase